jgi:hypothetical protein
MRQGPHPCRPEIDQQRQVALFEVALEACDVERHRVAVEQGLVAMPATPALLQPIARGPIDRVAVRTDDVKGRIHLALLVCGSPAVSSSGRPRRRL